jgi:hypothetical protein
MEKRMQILPPTIQYSNNKEYRQRFREIFDISESARTCYADIDIDIDIDVSVDLEDEEEEETKDELNYDTSMMEKGMEEWFLKTNPESNPIFKDLYLSAAGRMFSTDLRIGQAVICSYDTFHLYYACIWAFYHNKYISELTEYITLKKWFS